MKPSRLHFMGIGGQGISAVAQIAQKAGKTVTGCDRQASATTRALEKAGVAVRIGHSPAHVQDIDALIISPAVTALNPDQPELQAAQERGIPIVPWQQLLSELMQESCVISVSGVHGKGTTTAMLSLMLVDAGLDPTCEIGAVVPRFGTNYRLGKGKYFINEADEFNHNFWHYHPRLTVVTSIEFEHPEFFATYDAFLDAFEHFIRGMDRSDRWDVPPTLVLNSDSPGCHDLMQRLKDWPGRIVTYAINQEEQQERQEGQEGQTESIENSQMHVEAYDLKLEGETSFRVRSIGTTAVAYDTVFHQQLPGIHNIQNALAALTLATLLGIDASTIQ
ncbi:MAG: Mur ligase domain-containing protein, partial [Chloroflexota bacterium]|nr:Mur ligase domain-containing protein [Chloroflexota bacterium]